MFYDYRQNNSGGRFIEDGKVGKYVIIEASSNKDADNKAERIGIYFDGCSDHTDCSCCGNRWSRSYDEGKNEPKIYDQTIEEYKNNLEFSCDNKEIIHIYYKNGEHIIHELNTKEIKEKNKKAKREKADKTWGAIFNNYGLYFKVPTQFFYNESLKSFYDEGGNCSIKERGFCVDEEYRYYTLASNVKEDVEEFISGVQDALQMAIGTLEAKDNSKTTLEYKDGFKCVLKRLKGMVK